MRKVADKLLEDNWPIRRRVMFAALIYIALNVSWIVFKGTDNALYAQVALALIAAGTAIIGSYVFGAVWDDNNKRRHWRDHGRYERIEIDCDEPPTLKPGDHP